MFDLWISQTVRLHPFSFFLQCNYFSLSRSADNLARQFVRIITSSCPRFPASFSPTHPPDQIYSGTFSVSSYVSRRALPFPAGCVNQIYTLDAARPPLRSVIKRKSTNYNWRTARNAGAAAANNPNRSEQTADATQKESKQRDRFAQFRSFCWRHDSKMDYVTVSLCCV